MIRLFKSPASPATSANQSLLHLSRQDPPGYVVRSSVAPASSMVMSQPDIMADDWDALFQAVQTRLETCVHHASTHAQDLPLHERHAATFQAVLECVADMRYLHAALTQERQTQQRH